MRVGAEIVVVAVSVAVGLLFVGALTWFYFSRVFPAFEEAHGSFKSVGVSRFRVPGSVRFKVFYPTTRDAVEKSGAQKPAVYTDPRTFEGINAFTGVWTCVFSFLTFGKSNCQCFENAPIAAANNESKQWPIVVFSHGNCGNWDMNSQMCTHFASFGFVVFVPDFDDGSAAFTVSCTGENMVYTPALIVDDESGEEIVVGTDRNKPKREHMQKWRQPQLEHRLKRVEELLMFLHEAGDEDSDESLSTSRVSEMPDSELVALRSLLQCSDLSQQIHAGHSFGGANAVLYAKRKPSANLKAVVCYEPWATPMSEEQLEEHWEVPYFCLIGDEWSAHSLYKHSRMLVASNSCDKLAMDFVHGMEHTALCDVVYWSPDFAPLKSLCGCGDQCLSRSENSKIISGRTMDFLKGVLGEECVNGTVDYNKEAIIDCLEQWTEERTDKYHCGEQLVTDK